MAETTKKATEKTYPVRLPRLKGENASQVEFFSVNGKNWTINRGETVNVPAEVYEVILHSQAAEDEAEMYAEELKRRENEPKV